MLSKEIRNKMRRFLETSNELEKAGYFVTSWAKEIKGNYVYANEPMPFEQRPKVIGYINNDGLFVLGGAK